MASQNAEKKWFELGVFKYFNFSEEEIAKFTINPNASAVVRKEEKNRLNAQHVTGKCKFCKFTGRVVYGKPSNWVRHLLQHPDEHSSYKASVAPARKRALSPDPSLQSSSTQDSFYAASNKKPTQETIVDAMNPENIAHKKRKMEEDKKLPKEHQDRVNHRAFELVVGACLPIGHVENIYFRNYSKEIDTRVTCMCSKTLKLRIAKESLKFKSYLKSEFQSVSHVCLTADCWGARNRAFLGVTAHWLVVLPDGTIVRRSAALACKRFTGSHTYDKIAEMMQAIMEDYSLPACKVSHVITDNGSNFVKAFKEYSPNMAKTLVENAETELADYAEDAENEDAIAAAAKLLDELDSEEPIDPQIVREAVEKPISAYELLQQNLEDAYARITLPDHLRCASHTLDLIAKRDTDLSKFDSAKDFPKKNQLRSAWSKITALWNKIGQSIQANEKIKETLGASLPRPCPTRWNTFYDCVASFLLHYKNLKTINDLFQSIGITALFTKEDIDLLHEYAELMKPLADALDMFQGEKVFHGIGMVLPLLTRIKKRLLNKYFPNLAPIRKRVIEKIDERFGNLFSDEQYVIAAVTHPQFKTKWMTSEAARGAKSKLKQLVYEASTPAEERTHQAVINDFLVDEDNRSDNEDALDEVDHYLREKDETIAVLNKYPAIKQLFLKYNTSIPTSAPVERLFSTAAIILTVRRNRLSDALLEMLILLKIYLNLRDFPNR